MLLRVYLLFVVFACAALLVRAADEDDEEALESRGGYKSSSRRENNQYQRGSSYRGGSSKGRENNDENDEENNDNKNGDSSGRSGGGLSDAQIAALVGDGFGDRNIDLGTSTLGTTYSRSASSNVIKTRRDKYYSRNFVNHVNANLRLVRKKVHVHKHITYKRPLTVDNIKVHQQTNYVKNIYPLLKNLSVKEYGTIIQPARLITIERTANSNRRTVIHKVQVSSNARKINVGTRVARTQNLGIRELAGLRNLNGL